MLLKINISHSVQIIQNLLFLLLFFFLFCFFLKEINLKQMKLLEPDPRKVVFLLTRKKQCQNLSGSTVNFNNIVCF